MAVLNDFGDAGVARVEKVLQDFAKQLGVDKEYVYAYFNGTGHLPQTIDEFNTFLSDPNNNPYHFARRDAATGALNGYLHPGDTPGTMGAKDPGFRHVITNAEDTAVQRFQQVDPNGNIWGGSWDPAYNAAHPGGGPGVTAADVTRAGLMSAGRGAQSENPYPVGSPYHDTWEQGNPSGTPFGSGTPTPSSGGGSSAGGGYAVPSGGGTYQTANGPKSLPQIESELRAAGYGGPWDEASLVAAYTRTAGGGSGAGGGAGGAGGNFGLDDAFNSKLYGNQQTYQNISLPESKARVDQIRSQIALATNADQRAALTLKLQQAQQEFNQQLLLAQRDDLNRQNDRTLYSGLAQNLVNAGVNLGSRPADYFKYNQMLSGGRDIFQQLFGSTPRADFSSFSGGQPRAGNVADLMTALGMPQVPAGAQPGLPTYTAPSDARADAIAKMPQIRDAWNAGLKRYGVNTFQPQDPRLLQMYQNVFDLDPAGASQISQKAYDYLHSMGHVAPDDQVAGWIANTRGAANPYQGAPSGQGGARAGIEPWQRQPAAQQGDPMAYLKRGGRSTQAQYAF